MVVHCCHAEWDQAAGVGIRNDKEHCGSGMGATHVHSECACTSSRVAVALLAALTLLSGCLQEIAKEGETTPLIVEVHYAKKKGNSVLLGEVRTSVAHLMKSVSTCGGLQGAHAFPAS